MDRRHFLKLIALGVVAHELDLDKLLWVPGEKKIFLPPKGVSLSEIVSVEIERMLPKIQSLFERDDYFYQILKKQDALIMARQMRVPLITEEITVDSIPEPTNKSVH
jgi:hypothetical protein